MKILHYALGFPPYRTGGLTKYCIDLMLTQVEQGHEVALLWPGEIHFILKKTKIKERNHWNGIRNFELIDPLPVSLDEGIIEIEAYTKRVNESVYLNFLRMYMPDVIHIHTLMGLHKEFLDVAKQLKIKTVFTTHDYFGICPIVTLYHDGCVCDDDHDCLDCVKCNQTALGLKKIEILQSPIYRCLKNTKAVKMLRNCHRQKYFESSENKQTENENCVRTAEEYRKLREYYISMLNMIDFIHFNSSVTEMVYNRYFHPKNSAVISITHRDIKDHRIKKNFDHDALRITYLGPAKPFKGFQFLIGVLDELWKETPGMFELHIYTNTNVEKEYITHRQDGYPYSQLEEIFDKTDLLIVPSQWYETFGFTVLEALSYGVPVMVTNKVGAKDLVQYIDPAFICVNKELNLDKIKLEEFSSEVCRRNIIKTEMLHEKEMEKVYQGLI